MVSSGCENAQGRFLCNLQQSGPSGFKHVRIATRAPVSQLFFCSQFVRASIATYTERNCHILECDVVVSLIILPAIIMNVVQVALANAVAFFRT